MGDCQGILLFCVSLGVWYHLCHEGTAVTVMSSAGGTDFPPQPTSIMARGDPGSPCPPQGAQTSSLPWNNPTQTHFSSYFITSHPVFYPKPSQAKHSHQPQHSHVPILTSRCDKPISGGITELPVFTPPSMNSLTAPPAPLGLAALRHHHRNSAASENP